MESSTDEPDAVTQFVFDNSNSERSPWKFCNAIILPRSEVVYFTQVTTIILLILLCSLFMFFELACNELSIWIAILSRTVGYMIPNPQL